MIQIVNPKDSSPVVTVADTDKIPRDVKRWKIVNTVMSKDYRGGMSWLRVGSGGMGKGDVVGRVGRADEMTRKKGGWLGRVRRVRRR